MDAFELLQLQAGACGPESVLDLWNEEPGLGIGTELKRATVGHQPHLRVLIARARPTMLGVQGHAITSSRIWARQQAY